MKVLVVSHNVFSETESMGRTLANYFNCWNKNDIAQFYIHSEVPTTDVCVNYYNVTDKDVIKSILTRKSGRILGEKDIEIGRNGTRTDTGVTAKIYQKARKRTPLIYIARNLIWRLGAWKNRQLKKWLNDFNPDVIFFASGDYAFTYRIALWMAKRKKVPLVISCMDDYYFNNKNKDVFLGKLNYSLFMKSVRKAVKYSSLIFTICDKMTNDYSALFNKNCITVHTSASFDQPLAGEKGKNISYLGNLGYQRHKQLVEIGKALKELNHPDLPKCVDVYSSENREHVLSWLTEDNGIKFHGVVPYEQVKKIMAESLAVIHTENFDQGIRRSVRYSVSTKIADSLTSGTCLFVYGPDDIASIEYVKDNQAGIVATDKEQLKEKLMQLADQDVVANCLLNADKLSKRNHLLSVGSSIIKTEIEKVVKS